MTINSMGTMKGNVTDNGTLVVVGSSVVVTLTMTGNYTQGASGMLRMEIASASSYDVLSVSGTAMFAGTLGVSTLGVYTPSSGAGFALIRFASSGGSFMYTQHHDSANYTLTAVAESEGESDDPWAAGEGRVAGPAAPAVDGHGRRPGRDPTRRARPG